MHRLLIIYFLFVTSTISAQDTIINFTKENGLTSNEITTTLVDSKGIVWVGTKKGLNAYGNNKWFQIFEIENKETGKPSPLDKVETIFEDNRGYIWVSTSNGLFLYNRNYWIGFINNSEKEHIVTAFYQDSRGWLWTMQEDFKNFVKEMGIILANGTIHMFNGSSWYEYDSVVAGTAGIIHTRQELKFFTDFLEANNGDIWVSSLDGLFRFDGVKWNDYHEFDSKAVKSYDIMQGNDDDIWVASEYGISRYTNAKWVDYTKKEGLINTYFDVLKQDQSNRIWAYTKRNYSFNGLNMFDGEKWFGFSSNDIQLKGAVDELLFLDSIVIAFSNYGVSRFEGNKWKPYKRESGLKDKKYDLIMKDVHNQIWLGGEKRLYRYNGKDWETVLEPKQDWEVVVIYIDKEMTCWIGTKKNGVYRLLKNKSWVHYSEDNGLSDNHINDVFGDKWGNIWVLTDDGISAVGEK